MKLSDYMVQFLLQNDITEFFGYQGTMIAHFVDSVDKNPDAHNHSCYNEQGAAFAACGYAITTGKASMAYATSGPGAINLVSGIANAYYDSLPVIFITGQLNTYEYRNDLPNLRQNGFQESKVVDIVRPVTKYAVQLWDANDIRYELEKAVYYALSGRKGPVLIDIPMNLQRADIDPDQLRAFTPPADTDGISDDEVINAIKDALSNSRRPVLLLGNGMNKDSEKVFIRFAEALRLPVVTSLLAKNRIPADHELNFGYLGGAYGHRYANFIVSEKSDQLISFGMSLCTRQTGTNVANFAQNAKVLRFDIDQEELNRKIKSDEKSFLMDTSKLADILSRNESQWSQWNTCSDEWLCLCNEYKEFCKNFDDSLDDRYPNKVVAAFNKHILPGDVVVSDVGQHMMWVGQSIDAKENTPILFSGAHGAMGFAIPAAIGAGIARPDNTVFCFCGDGSAQMNIQELEWIKREKLNIVMIVLNNYSLGLIAQQQDAYFDGLYYGAAAPYYTAPSFCKISLAYGIDAENITSIEQIDDAINNRQANSPFLLEYSFDKFTRAYPKTKLGEKIHNQEPELPAEELMKYLSK